MIVAYRSIAVDTLLMCGCDNNRRASAAPATSTFEAEQALRVFTGPSSMPGGGSGGQSYVHQVHLGALIVDAYAGRRAELPERLYEMAWRYGALALCLTRVARLRCPCVMMGATARRSIAPKNWRRPVRRE